MSEPSQLRLLTQRRFLPFFIAQLTGAGVDTLLKNVLLMLVTYHAAQYSAKDPALLTNIAAGLFILPFVFFSAIGGQLADKYDKALVVRVIKVVEVAIMALAGVGFVRHDVNLLLGALFLMGTHSAFFGPVKYSVLPRVLREDELVGGNGLVEMGTFLIILVGTIGAGLLVSATSNAWVLSGVLTAVSVVGAIASFAMPRTGAASPELKVGWNPVTESWKNVQFARGNRTVFLSLLGISWFWFFGALLLSQFASYGKVVLGGNEGVVTVLLALFSVGVGLGSFLCESLSGHKVEIGLVPFGSIGLTAFAVDLYFASPSTAAVGMTVGQFFSTASSWRIVADLVGVGLFGGFYIVPLYALVQSRSEKTHQSRIIAANNILNAVFMVAAAGIAAGLLAAGVSIPQLILACGLFNAVVAVYIYTLVPEFLWRFCDWLLVHTLYRVRREGLENIPEEGPALLVANHVSYVDALVIAAYVRRPIRFVMDHNIFRVPVLGFLFRAVRAIPIASAKEDSAVLERAFSEVAQALRNGELVCVFPEGKLTPDGTIQPFRPGVERILQSWPVQVVPLALSGLWGGAESRRIKPLVPRLLSFRPFRRITLRAGAALPHSVTSAQLQEHVQALRGPTP